MQLDVFFQVPIPTQERDEEVKQLQEKHSKEISELMQTWIKELRLLGDRLLEKTEASSALSCQLKAMERQTEIQEEKLKSQVTDEIHRIEQIINLQKVIANLNLAILQSHGSLRSSLLYI